MEKIESGDLVKVAVGRRELDGVVFMTGVGTRYLMETLESRHARDRIVAALRHVTVVARGPKPEPDQAKPRNAKPTTSSARRSRHRMK